MSNRSQDQRDSDARSPIHCGAPALRAIALALHHRATPALRNLGYKLYRSSLPRPLKHMATASPRFALSAPDPSSGERNVFWDGRVVGKVRSPASVQRSQRGSCFIVATGPSLAQVDLSLLRSFPTMGVNGAIPRFTAAGFSPSYFAITDPDFFENRFAMVRETIQSGANCFFSYSGLSRICEQDPSVLNGRDIFLVEVLNRHFGIPRLSLEAFRQKYLNDPDIAFPDPPRADDSRVGFSRNVAKGLFCSRTILYRAIQIAYHIGFRRIFILGMDLDYQGNSPRFYETRQNMRPSKIAADYDPYILPSFLVLQRVCQSENLQVFNLSPTSRLPESVMPRLSLEEALALVSATATK